jgi:hypothetical protein
LASTIGHVPLPHRRQRGRRLVQWQRQSLVEREMDSCRAFSADPMLLFADFDTTESAIGRKHRTLGPRRTSREDERTNYEGRAIDQ